MNTISVASLNKVNEEAIITDIKYKLFLGLNESAAKGQQKSSYKISPCNTLTLFNPVLRFI